MTSNSGGAKVPETLVTGASGIVGRRVVSLMRARGLAVRAASRSATPPFEWDDPVTWEANLDGVRRLVLISPEGVPVHPDFLPAAAAAGVQRVSLLSDRGAEVMRVDRLLEAERRVRTCGLRWTVVRPDWFNQDFDESFFRPGILIGRITVPIGNVRQGFVDADDIAAVLIETLLDERHREQTYLLTGPTALSFAEAVDVIGAASARRIEFAGDVDSFWSDRSALGVDPAQIQREVDSFARLAALGDAVPSPDVERVLGRPAIAFASFARRAAAAGAWR